MDIRYTFSREEASITRGNDRKRPIFNAISRLVFQTLKTWAEVVVKAYDGIIQHGL